METPEEVVDRVERAMEFVPKERIALNPDCGFSPSSANPMDLDEAYLKLRNEAEAARRQAEEREQAIMAEEKKENAGLRVFVQGGGCSGFQYGLMIEEGAVDPDADRVFESNGVKLFVDPISIRYLTGAEVDFVDNLTGGGFTIKNPNAKSTCGCGSSFGV